jgi:hypothetical protein
MCPRHGAEKASNPETPVSTDKKSPYKSIFSLPLAKEPEK